MVKAKPRSNSVLGDAIILLPDKSASLHNTAKKNNTPVCVLRMI
jgi:hypothetical protein